MAGQNDRLGTLEGLAARLLPGFLLARLDPVEKTISEHVERFARSLLTRSVVLDAGAREARFRSHFYRQQSVALDNRQGNAAWDYSRLHGVGGFACIAVARGFLRRHAEHSCSRTYAGPISGAC